jgi:dihydropteroate synthase
MTGRPLATLDLGDRTLSLDPAAPALMGIVNASPESFSDGGALPDVDAQVEQGLRLAAEGAAIVDVGGESGVTDRRPISPDEETERVVPVVERLARAGVTVSVDTWKAAVARAALGAGASMVNDASALRDPGVAAACAEHRAALVVTHTRAAPKVKAFPAYGDVMPDVLELLAERVRIAERLGVACERIVVDPGLDLAKTPAQSVELLRRLGELRRLGRPVLLAASRKDFVGALTVRPPAARLGGTLAAVAAGADAGAAILRVHDVAAVADFLAVRAALQASTTVDAGLHLPRELRRERAEAA